MKDRVLVAQLSEQVGKKVTIAGWIHNVRDLGKIAFVVLRDRSGTIQCVIEKGGRLQIEDLRLESVMKISGVVAPVPKSTEFEIQVESFELLAPATQALPFEIHKAELDVRLDTMLDHRLISLRNLKTRSIFTAQAKILQYICCFYY